MVGILETPSRKRTWPRKKHRIRQPSIIAIAIFTIVSHRRSLVTISSLRHRHSSAVVVCSRRHRHSSAVAAIVSPLPSSPSSVLCCRRRTLRDFEGPKSHRRPFGERKKKRRRRWSATTSAACEKKILDSCRKKNKNCAKCSECWAGVSARRATSTTEAKVQPHHQQSRSPEKGWGRPREPIS